MKRFYFSKLITLIILISGLTAFQAGAQCNCSWQYVVPITIANSGGIAQTDYQISIVVNTQALITAGKMQATGNDIRFTDNGGLCNNLSYWIESGINTTTTKIWIKVNSIAASGNTVINMYYGNPSAVAASDGNSTFIIFDDFNGATLDAAKWSFQQSGGTATVSGGTLSISNSTWGEVESVNSFAGPYISEIKVNAETNCYPSICQADNGNYNLGVTMFLCGTTMYFYASSGSPVYSSNLSNGLAVVNAVGVWSIVRTTTNTICTWPGGTYTYSGQPNSATSANQSMAFGDLNGSSSSMTIDWARGRKYYAGGTTQTVGSESVNGAQPITGVASVCTGATTTLSDATPSGSWTSGASSIATVSSSGVVTGLTAGTATITYTAGACSPATVVVTVNPSPSISGVTNVCTAQTTTLTGTPAGGTWTSGTPGQATVGLSSGVVTGVTAGTVPNITYTAIGGCQASIPVTVNSSPLPISGPGSVCGSLTISLTDPTPGGTWSSSNTALASINPTTGLVTGGVVTGVVTISYTSTLGCPITTPVTVNAMSPIAGPSSICLGSTTTLTNAISGGAWSSTNPSVATINSSGFVTSVATGATTISYVVPGALCIPTLAFNVSGTPGVFAVTGGGAYCSGGTGVAIGLNGSNAGVGYQLFNGLVAVGSEITGSGFPISLGLVTGAGTYTVVANPFTSCSTTMTGTATITINPLPTAYSMTGGGSFCTGGTGVTVSLSSSNIGTNYQLFVTPPGGSPIPVGSTVLGTGAALAFGLQTTVGAYTVVGTNTVTGCIGNMAGSVTVTTNPLPVAQVITGGGNYCNGGSGVTIGLANSVVGINYQLVYSGAPTGPVVAGTGFPISFGVVATGGTYTVLATNPSTGCTNTMSGSATVTVVPLPFVFTVTGGGNYCFGSAVGVPVGLNGSTIGVNYQLYKDGILVGSPVAGTGVALNFGIFTATGAYSVVATNAAPPFCSINMFGSVAIGTNPLPTLFTVTGGGGYCAGGSGSHVFLSGSVIGTNYQLLCNGGLVTIVGGTGAAIDFGFETLPGTYTVIGTVAATGCTQQMSSSVVVTLNPLPLVETVTGGGNYCAGYTTGFPTVNVTPSQIGVSYQLFNGALPVGSPLAGTGAPLAFSFLTAPGAGSYTVVATNTTTTCTNNMTGSVTIGTNPLPSVYPVTGGGGYCNGGTGVHIGLAASNFGINYALIRTGAGTITTAPGAGASIDFGTFTTAGTYSVQASNGTTTCTVNMSGSVVVTVNPLPVSTYSVTAPSGTTYCSGGTGVPVSLSGSDLGFTYQLMNAGLPVGAPVAGTNFGITFGLQTLAGTYTVVATNTATGCTATETGNVTVGINTLPFIYPITGGGTHCLGGTGNVIGMSNTQSGVSYQLYNGPGTVGVAVAGSTGSPITFGPQTAAGTYTVVAINQSTGCTNPMSGTAVVSILPLPNSSYIITGGGGYCQGGSGLSIGLSNSSIGINYQLWSAGLPVGAPMAGTGTSLDFGAQTTGGAYTIVGTNASTGCAATMTGTATIVVNSLPSPHAMTGGGNYCPGGSGVPVGIDGSNTGISYQLYLGSVATGIAMPGTGAAIAFGPQTVPGIYTIKATNTSTACVANMTGSETVGLYTLPLVYNVTGGGNFCPAGDGVHVGLSGSSLGVSYQLYNGAPVGSPIAGTGFSLDFGLQTASGAYTVVAMNNTSLCTKNMTGSAVVVINPLPSSYTVTGGGDYCQGTTGVDIGLDGSSVGDNYQLMMGALPIGSAMVGTGLPLDFGPQTASGVYTVVATGSATTCSTTMISSALINVVPLPSAFTVTGGGDYCADGTGVNVGLSSSESTCTYQLYNGVLPAGIPVAGTGAAISFGPQTAGGTYTVVATNTTTGCVKTMTGTAHIVVDPLPTAYTVTGGGNYCTGGTGVHVMLSSSNVGINYQLKLGGGAVGSPVAGTGSSLDFGLHTAEGSYTVEATNTTTGCISSMLGSVVIVMSPLPNIYTVVGAGTNYCAGGLGIDISMAGSDAGISYQLRNGSTASGSPMIGFGLYVDFGYQTAPGTYTVVAMNPLTGCTSNMTGAPIVIIDPLPTSYTVVGGGSYCNGGTGVHIGLSNSAVGISYQLFNGTPTGSPILGTGFPIDFGLQTAAGTYTIVGRNIATSCTNTMSGSATVVINPLPAVFTVTGGGNYCAGDAGVHVGISGSSTGVNYQLYNGLAPVGSLVAGTGLAIDFGFQSAGSYSVMAINATTGCTSSMAGSVNVGTNPLPNPFTVNGGGGYCDGGAGVNVGISGSQIGIDYQVFNGVSPVGIAWHGTGVAVNFGLMTAPGTYKVVGTNTSTGCTNNMSGTATVVVNPLPSTFTLIGGGNYCAGGAGVHIGLNSSSTGVTYQLYNGLTSTGAPVTGTGGPVDFGLHTAGSYTVIATNSTTGCTNTMSGTMEVVATPLVSPSVSLSTGVGDTVCAGRLVTVTALAGNGGTTPSFHWTVNGIAQSAVGNNFSYMPSNGDIVDVTMTSSAACATPPTIGNSMTLIVLDNGMPTATVTAAPGDSVCTGTNVDFSVATAFGGDVSLTWIVNGLNAATGASYSYIPSNNDVVYVVMNSTYRCRLANSVQSNHVNMFVSDPVLPTVTIVANPNNTHIAHGQALTLTASVTDGGPAPSYQWFVNGFAIGGANLATFTSSNYSDGDSVTCQVLSSGPCSGLLGFNSVIVHVSSVGVHTIATVNGDIQVVPNPNKGFFVVKGTLGTTADEEVALEVTNMLGQVVYSQKIMTHGGSINEKVTLDNNIANGMYILNLRSESDSKVFHIVVEN